MNSYDSAIATTVGPAHELVQGNKPYCPDHIESEGWIDALERIGDIDEGDE
jgi:hypothetical protein